MRTSNFIIPDKLNMIIDGSFGSTGKGLIASAIATDNHIDFACTTTSPNAGHTFYHRGEKYVTHLIPVAGIIHRRSTIIFSADSVIDLKLFFNELRDFDIDPSRVLIHPRASVITEEDKRREQEPGGLETIASTQTGVGSARAGKILRTQKLVQGTPELQHYILKCTMKSILNCGNNLNVLVETGQGLGLDINHGLAYPYCTSRSVLPATILGEFGLHPRFMGNCMLSFRTFPIRVGNIQRNGKEIGFSGPFFPDSKEITFDDLWVEPEMTTVTKRIRRVATFSREQYEQAVDMIEPTHVFFNFCNYYYGMEEEMKKLRGLKKLTHVGVGPHVTDVYKWEPGILQRIFK